MTTQPTPTAWQTAPPATQHANPMAGHVKAIAVINLVYAGLTFLVALGIIFALGVAGSAVDWSEQYGTPSFVANMLGALAFVLGALSIGIAVVYLLAGLRLLSLRRAGKGLGVFSAILQIVVGLFTVLGGFGIIPLGTGIYSLVILLRGETDQLLAHP
ncbi:MAG TPA: hypothetical protein VM327_10270 [Candidatus Thermoplasmatota archaeon]|nr:hypothetical protein [Candidatus Thermoplasmatota archaeon]